VDAALFTAINGAHAPLLDRFMLAITWSGVGAAVWFALALAALCWPRHRAAAVRALLLLAVTLAVNDLLIKRIVHRPRPFDAGTVAARVIQVPAPTTASFPSGHAATAAAGAMAMARVWPAARWAFAGVAVLIAVSRIYVGVHYPTDVLAGVLLGLACAWLVLAGRHPSTWSRAAPPPPGSRYVP
jgi:membrane-associated phospholipid phosphatase